MSGLEVVSASPAQAVSTALERCVLHVAAHHGRPLTVGALHDALSGPRQSGITGEVRAAIAAAEQAGLQAAFGHYPLAQIDAGLMPAILLTKSSGAVVLHRREGETAAIHDPRSGEALIDVPVAELERDLTGHVLVLRPEHRRATDEREAGVRGHWFRDAISANRWAYIQVGLAATIINSLALVTSLFTMVVYDRILPSAATDSLFALTIGVAVALVFDLVLKTLRAGFIDHAGKRADLDMGQRVFDHLIETEMAARKGSVGAVSATMREFESLRDFFTSATMVALVDLPFVVIFVGAIYLLAGPLAIVPAITVPLVLLIGVAVQPILGRLADRVLSEGQMKQTVLVETLTGIETIKAAGAGLQMRVRWAEAIRRQSSYAVKSRAVTQGAINATGFVQQSSQILIVVYGALLVVSGQITSGVLIAAVILTGRALAPLALISQTLTRLHQARSSYRSIEMLMQAPGEHPAGRQFLSRPRLSGEISFDGVSFAYPDQQGAALDDVSFDIAPGERVAILGPIGSGKSTVARLLLGLYQPTEGAVLADGIDIRQIDPTDLRRNTGAVLQEPWLLSGTLRENIAFGAVRPRDDEILEAARLAGVEAFAARHPEGYDMRLGERGQGLSGGQRQAVALARALMGDPPILVLDEPTAAMDIQSEAALIARLKSVLDSRTLVLITHRTSLLDLVDRVIVIDGGKVIADGPKSLVIRRQASGGGA
ncbi:type I secretion system permease/ATPase [Roseibaca sp. V10]|uniref:Type I secretion system permease/ATPase n=1 Tax=Roseinatronobacter domitianus TaxID=2940293 RepID=A0ABT0M3V1_9RHOB|nr:type I secretion system permease/ATPase [Roseibaca domitiana]MCL1629534.1 type I secretion system permease/ATPase [Roseibaca domitiana]